MNGKTQDLPLIFAIILFKEWEIVVTEIKSIKIDNLELNVAGSDDPLISRVSWRPAKLGGANFKTQNLKLIKHKMVVTKSIRAKLFAAFFIVPGFAALLVAGPIAFLKGDIVSGIFSMIWGGIFGGGGWFLCYERRFQFDKETGNYFRGKEFKRNAKQKADQQGYLDTIHAIQLLSERVTSNSTSGSSYYLSYELNLVFKNGERANVMDSGDGNNVEKAAIQLADYLNVPIWKAVY